MTANDVAYQARLMGLNSSISPRTDLVNVWADGCEAVEIYHGQPDAEITATLKSIKEAAGAGATARTAKAKPAPSKEQAAAIGSIYARLARIQARGLRVAKNGEGSIRGQRSYQYATLDDVLAIALPALAAEGLALVQTVIQTDGQQALRTAICNADGNSVESTIVLPPASDWHAFGSGLSYSRRYSLTALLGIAADLDDDGHAALPQPPQRQQECHHCHGPMKIGPKTGVPYCPDCYRNRVNGYARMNGQGSETASYA